MKKSVKTFCEALQCLFANLQTSDNNRIDTYPFTKSIGMSEQDVLEQQDVAELNWTVPQRVSDWMNVNGTPTDPNKPITIASPYSITSSYFNQGTTGQPQSLSVFNTPSSTYMKKSSIFQRSRNSSRTSLISSSLTPLRF